MAYQLTSKDIKHLLELLRTELVSRGVPASAYVVGGAAIALTYDTGRQTEDVDAALDPQDAVLAAARSVADAEGLPATWLNTHAMAWIPARPTHALGPPAEAGLRVEIATPQTLLAMKLVASRNRDIPDIKLLAETIGMTDPVELADLVREQYGDDQLDMLGGYADMRLWCERLVRQLWG